MDSCLKRLRHELHSMKEAGDGLHSQMNFMMGALQELKLLQVQTALEQLEISGKKNCMTPPAAESFKCKPQDHQHQRPINSSQEDQVHFHNPHGNVMTLLSTSSLDSEGIPRKISPTLTDHQSMQSHSSRVTPVDLSGILNSLSREGPSIDSHCIEDSMDDTSDWTSSLMSRSRNRQPLVLGDSVLADLVGNWLDLPEVDKEGVEGGRKLNSQNSLSQPLFRSQSQELCKRFSFTSNIFKRLLRSVRPDRDKLLKEKPGWMPPGHDFEAELFKRPKKNAKAKGRFYLPFWGRGQQQAQSKLCLQTTDETGQLLGLYLDQKPTDVVEKVQSLLDYNAAVWV